jgi:M6 family metalloprotease-like protein
MPVAFYGKEFTFHDPDGAEIRVRGWGNQFVAVFETLDGFTVVKHPDTGYFHIATLSDDKTRLVPTEQRAATADTRALSLPRHIRITGEAARQEARRVRDQEGGQPRWEVRRAQWRNSRESGPDSEPPQPRAIGDYVGLCLLIRFPDVPDTISRQEVDAFCNRPGYSDRGNNGSVHDYFLDNSGGALRYTNIVTAYYTSRHKRDYYTDPSVPKGPRAHELIVEALDHLKRQGFDFSPLSADGDGHFYALNAMYAGPEVNHWGEGLYGHSGTLPSSFSVPGGRRFSDYQIVAMGDKLTLQVFCHENGHMLCHFPDLYDYGDNSSGVGAFCLMCDGRSDTNPVQICAYLKEQAGWAAQLTTITPGMSTTIPSTSNHFFIHRKNDLEYFIIENRQQAGRDSELPDAGLAIWHADTRVDGNENEQMTPTKHYECSLEQADGRFDLEHHRNQGDSEDLFAAPTATTFNNTSRPDSKWWDGTASGLNIKQISTSDTILTFKIA